MTYKFTNSAQNVLEIAKEIAIELGHNYIGTEHILYGLTEEELTDKECQYIQQAVMGFN